MRNIRFFGKSSDLTRSSLEYYGYILNFVEFLVQIVNIIKYILVVLSYGCCLSFVDVLVNFCREFLTDHDYNF